MKNILADKQRGILDGFLEQRVLLAFDFDGTLAPLVPDPSAAALPRKTRQLLRRLASLYPCVVISGRARADVRARLAGIPLRAVLGNHGIEPVRNPRLVRRRVLAWRARLARVLPAIPGLVVEDKGVTLALHYRQARGRAKVRQLLVEVARRLPGSKLTEGKMVVNVLPAGTGNKGTALVDLRRRFRCPAALFLGDDDNDEDVFALSARGGVLGIRVGRSSRSRADYFIPRQSAVNALLMRLVATSKTAARGGPSVREPPHRGQGLGNVPAARRRLKSAMASS